MKNDVQQKNLSFFYRYTLDWNFNNSLQVHFVNFGHIFMIFLISLFILNLMICLSTLTKKVRG